MAYEKQSFQDGQVLEAKHLNHMEDGIEEANKAIVSVGGDTLEWDGNTEGAELVAGLLYKASGVVPTKEDFASGCTVTFIGSNLPGGSGGSLTMQNSAEEVLFSNDGMGMVTKGGVFIIPSDNYEFEEDGDITVFPEKGVYFQAQGWVTTLTIPGYTGFAKKQIKEEYLPKTSWNDLTDRPFVVANLSFETMKLDIALDEVLEITRAGGFVMFGLTMTQLSVGENEGVATEGAATSFAYGGENAFIASTFRFSADGRFVGVEQAMFTGTTLE